MYDQELSSIVYALSLYYLFLSSQWPFEFGITASILQVGKQVQKGSNHGHFVASKCQDWNHEGLLNYKSCGLSIVLKARGSELLLDHFHRQNHWLLELLFALPLAWKTDTADPSFWIEENYVLFWISKFILQAKIREGILLNIPCLVLPCLLPQDTSFLFLRNLLILKILWETSLILHMFTLKTQRYKTKGTINNI